MSKTLNKLFYHYTKKALQSKDINKLEAEIENKKKCLCQNLDKRQKELLINIEDKKDLINDLSNLESFSIGFKLGLKIGYEVNNE